MSAPFVRVERAPMLLVFGPHAARMASLVRVRPSLLSRIAFAPPSAVHAIGGFLYLARQADQPDPELAALLDESDPRDLLQVAIPQAPAHLYRAMERAGDRVRDHGFYARLAAVCTSPEADLLWGDHPIEPALLDFAERVVKLEFSSYGTDTPVSLRADCPRSSQAIRRRLSLHCRG